MKRSPASQPLSDTTIARSATSHASNLTIDMHTCTNSGRCPTVTFGSLESRPDTKRCRSKQHQHSK
eukprot:1955798-Amphidinium_carterae.3